MDGNAQRHKRRGLQVAVSFCFHGCSYEQHGVCSSLNQERPPQSQAPQSKCLVQLLAQFGGVVLLEEVCHWWWAVCSLASCLAQSVSFQLPINVSAQPLWIRIPLNHISSFFSKFYWSWCFSIATKKSVRQHVQYLLTKLKQKVKSTRPAVGRTVFPSSGEVLLCKIFSLVWLYIWPPLHFSKQLYVKRRGHPP